MGGVKTRAGLYKQNSLLTAAFRIKKVGLDVDICYRISLYAIADVQRGNLLSIGERQVRAERADSRLGSRRGSEVLTRAHTHSLLDSRRQLLRLCFLILALYLVLVGLHPAQQLSNTCLQLTASASPVTKNFWQAAITVTLWHT